MNSPKRNLKPVAIALQGLLALSASASWTPTAYYHGTGFFAEADPATGYTHAEYDRSGYSLNIYRYVKWTERGHAQDYSLDELNGVSFVALSYSWSETTFSYGHCEVIEDGVGGGDAYAEVQSSF